MANKCRHCGKSISSPRIRIAVVRGGHTSSFYYPDKSYKTEAGGMKMLIDTMDELNENGEQYGLKIIRDVLVSGDEQ